MSTDLLQKPTTQIKPRKFTIAEYMQMGEAGIFAESERVELLEGEVYVMSPIGPSHGGTVDRLNSVLVKMAEPHAIVRVQNPIVLDQYSQPQPDFALLKPRDDSYFDAHPLPYEMFLAIEVSQSSLSYDRNKKLPLYAKAGIAEVWIIDVNKRQIEQFSQPDGKQYKQHTIKASGDSITAMQLPSVTFEIDRLFTR